MTKMLKESGYIMHIGPLNNWVDHGFYQLSPTLYCDYYLDNNFIVKEGRIFRYRFGPGNSTLDLDFMIIGDMTNYFTQQYPDGVLQGIFDNHRYGYFFMAQKTNYSTSSSIPIQHTYASDKLKTERLSKLQNESNICP